MPTVERHRDDIQGLRAVAVTLVVAAHAGFAAVAGGFVGVDVFFVISGYLIVGLLVREGEQNDRISILGFYARRARRIIPAAAAVLVATVAASAYLLPVLRVTEILKDAVWAVFFGANIRFASVETDYFANGDPPSPLQHFWSLSVEEQFYLVVPALLIGVLLVVRRVRPDRFRAATGIVLAVLVIGSLLYATHAVTVDRAAAYFSTPARVWELGLGGLLATLGGRRRPGGRLVAELGAWAGVAMIGYAVLTFDGHTLMPSWPALLPVGGAALLLWAGGWSERATWPGRLLSTAPFRLVGDWSYSIYLWHFPVLLLARAHWGERDLGAVHLAIALVAIAALSGASYYLVEQPFRSGRMWKPTGVATALYPAGVLCVIVAVLAANTWIHSRLDGRSDNPAIMASDYAKKGLSSDPVVRLVQASVLAARDHRGIPGDLDPNLFDLREDTAPLGDCDYRTGTHDLCPMGDPDADRSIVLLGDSHARAWSPAFDKIGKTYGYAVYSFVFSGCPANAVTRFDPANGGPWTMCADFKQWAIEQTAALHPDFAVVSNASYMSSRLRTHQVHGLRKELSALKQAGAPIVVLGNTPKVDRAPGVCLSARGADLGDCLLHADSDSADIQAQFGSVARQLGGSYVDAGPWFCVDLDCPAVVGRQVTLRDSEHMTTEYAETLAEPLARALGLSTTKTEEPTTSR